MNLRAPAMLGLAAVLGVLSVGLTRSWLDRQLARGAPAATATVAVAGAALDFGHRLEKKDLRLVSWPADALPEGSYASVDSLFAPGEERIVLRPIEPNEPILAAKLSRPGERATLSTVLPPDKRAVTIRVNDVMGVAGFVLPGDRVDVLLTQGQQADRSDAATDILLQDLRVLAIDQEASERKDKPTVAKAVTLEVSPDQAARLTLGAQIGSLSLALRNHADASQAPMAGVTLADLRTARAEVPRKKVATVARTAVVIMRGTEISSAP